MLNINICPNLTEIRVTGMNISYYVEKGNPIDILYRMRSNYRTVRLGVSKLLNKKHLVHVI